MDTLHEIMNAAICMWVKIRGIKDDDNDWDTESEIETIRTAQEIDDTGLTALMMLNAIVRDYASKQKFSMLYFIEKRHIVQRKYNQINELLDLLNGDVATEAIAQFKQKIYEMLSTAGIENTFDEILKDNVNLAYIRYDALVAIRYLRRFNFRRGKRAKKLQYNKKIVKFWNINSALRAAEIQPIDGITLIMIRDPVVLYSHFMFLIHDGDNITVWTDQERTDHPLQKYMSRSRSQERRWEKRAFRLRFPYQLFDLKFDDDGKYRGEDGKNALVRTNVKAVPITDLDKLPPDQV